MSKYTIEFSASALCQLKKLLPAAQTQVQRVIDNLAENLRPRGYKKLHGKLKDFLRIDNGNFRVIYVVKDRILTVIVVKIGDRRDVYK